MSEQKAAPRPWTCDKCGWEQIAVDPSHCPRCEPVPCPWCRALPYEHPSPILRDEFLMINHAPTCFLAVDGQFTAMDKEEVERWSVNELVDEAVSVLRMLLNGLPVFPDPQTPSDVGIRPHHLDLTVGQINEARAVLAKVEKDAKQDLGTETKG